MANFTSNTYQMKREILNFSNKISRKLTKPQKKFAADMLYGMLASESCLLTDIVDQLHEPAKKVNSVERLTRHLNILVWYGMVQKAQTRKMFTKKGIMSPKPVSSPPTIIQSVFSRKYILLRKKTLLLSTISPFLPWKGDVSCLEKLLLSWIEGMMTTRSS